MKSITVTILPITLLSLAAAAAPTQGEHATAYIRLLTTQKTNYAPSQDQQLPPSSSSGGSITIPISIGQMLDLSADAQEVELQRITPGKDLQGVQVREEDERVVCKAMTGSSSKGVEVRVKDKRVLDEGRLKSVTGLFCEVR